MAKDKDAKVTSIFGGAAPNEPVQELITEIEHILAMAKSGELRAFAGVGILQDGISNVWYSTDNNASIITLSGTIGLLQLKIQTMLLENRE